MAILRGKAHKFLLACLSEPSMAKAMKAADISDDTTRKYLNNPAFKTELRNARSEDCGAHRSGLSNRVAAFNKDKFAGIGFNLTHSSVAVLDIDPEHGHNIAELTDAVSKLKAVLESSNVEASPRGKGVHVWFTGQLPDELRSLKQKQKVHNADGETLGEIEHYDGRDTRYLTVTGKTNKTL